MKIGGIDPATLPVIEVLPIPRGDKIVVFQARGLGDNEEFKKLCPEPTAPGKLTQNGFVSDETDPGYVASMAEHNKRFLAYLVVKSLEPSNIEWDTVDLGEPGTWCNWQKDLRNSGFIQTEINLVFQLCWEANQLDENKLKKAREAFLRGPQVA